MSESWHDLVDLIALAGWMDEQGLEHGAIEDASRLSGGTQNLLLLFRRGRREFVLRRPPRHLRSNSNETMRREARVLSALSTSDVPHPRLIAACADARVLGAAFYLMEPVQGFNAMVTMPALHAADPTMRRRMGLALVDAAVALARVDYIAAGLGDLGKPQGFLERQVARWRKQLDSFREHDGWPGPDSLPGVAAIAEWLDAHVPPAFTPGIMHGDYHLANVMFSYDDPRVVAIVDWELSTIGDPLMDLGTLLATWPDPGQPISGIVQVTPWEGFPSAEELVEQYARGSGHNLAAIDWYETLACYRLGIILEGTFARACAGKASQDAGDTLHNNALTLFRRALSRIKVSAPNNYR